jgi:hypothetical protein
MTNDDHWHPETLTIRRADGGWSRSAAAGRIGLRSNSPPQFGQEPRKICSAQRAQNVHSKLQMRAAALSAGRSVPQHSQQGRNSSMCNSVGTLEPKGLQSEAKARGEEPSTDNDSEVRS